MALIWLLICVTKFPFMKWAQSGWAIVRPRSLPRLSTLRFFPVLKTISFCWINSIGCARCAIVTFKTGHFILIGCGSLKAPFTVLLKGRFSLELRNNTGRVLSNWMQEGKLLGRLTKAFKDSMLRKKLNSWKFLSMIHEAHNTNTVRPFWNGPPFPTFIMVDYPTSVRGTMDLGRPEGLLGCQRASGYGPLAPKETLGASQNL